jgi:hypothetical protein
MQSIGCGEARGRQGRLVLPLLLPLLLVLPLLLLLLLPLLLLLLLPLLLVLLVLPLLVLLPCLLLSLELTLVAMRATGPSLPPCTRPAGEREWA